MNPDLHLRDLIRIFHPDLISEDFVYYLPLGIRTSIQNDAVTYYRPQNARSSIYWEDDQGNNGYVEWNLLHPLDSYDP
ncbi:MAG: hypothetical protein LUD68_05445 [Rikenellaceae bacterium]|nr:hypothetical protein [Rikenellaceae bacterium]